ncbi:MAG TPA: sensor histidine kinase KdpD [Anaerolineales bacterium]|nr:sensor histidine kinase KdpD [Anaerolineales bacterium]
MATQPPRPDPDTLLARIQAEEEQDKRGQLKVFLGYAAGVGKTYAMLEAAHQRKAEGVDVVIGYVETHKRAETEALVGGLEIVPRLQLTYRNVQLPEMDIDAVLKRRPRLVLVDELAHSNAPGSRHAKRYQDVLELLEAGFDVYTTLNIQHIESLNDVVAQITGMTVRETIPDSVIDEVNDLELVDLPPDELIKRLADGKVYVPDQAQRAIEQFFRKGNLTALRELAMRRAAERVDDQMRAYMRTRAIPGPWPASERLLVCISPGALGERLIRTARRLADELNAEWFAIYVETPDEARISQEQRDQVARSLRLAEELGARTVSRPGQSVPETVLEYARRHNVTKIIAGKPVRSRWIEVLRGSVVDRLIRTSGNIDVYVISSEAEPQPARRIVEGWRPHRPLGRYLFGLLLVATATGLGALISPDISPTNLVVVYLLAVVVAAVYLGRGPAILTSILGVAAFDYFFVPPHLTFAVANTEYLLTFFGLLGVGLVISELTARVQGQAEAVQRREAETVELYELGRDLTVAADLEAVAQAAITHVGQTFGREVAIFLLDGKRARVFAASPGLAISDNDLAVADWSFEHGQVAGRGTETLPEASMRYQPLRTTRGIVGVLGVKPIDPARHLTRDQLRTLDAFANQIGLAIERASLAEQARQAEVLEITDKLQTALLNSISHDLRTPLVSITGALSSLADDQIPLDESARRSLIETAGEEADRLNRLVGNLLDMTRLEAGAMRIKKEACDIQDLVGSALEALGGRLEDRAISIDIPPEIPLVQLDFVLIERVLVNVIDNALKYSPADSPIEIAAHTAGAFLEIDVADRGTGIPAEDLTRIFDKFYRVQRPDNVNGTGLGLSISKGIIQAHGGFIAAENREGGGTMITISIPLQ